MDASTYMSPYVESEPEDEPRKKDNFPSDISSVDSGYTSQSKSSAGSSDAIDHRTMNPSPKHKSPDKQSPSSATAAPAVGGTRKSKSANQAQQRPKLDTTTKAPSSSTLVPSNSASEPCNIPGCICGQPQYKGPAPYPFPAATQPYPPYLQHHPGAAYPPTQRPPYAAPQPSNPYVYLQQSVPQPLQRRESMNNGRRSRPTSGIMAPDYFHAGYNNPNSSLYPPSSFTSQGPTAPTTGSRTPTTPSSARPGFTHFETEPMFPREGLLDSKEVQYALGRAADPPTRPPQTRLTTAPSKMVQTESARKTARESRREERKAQAQLPGMLSRNSSRKVHLQRQPSHQAVPQHDFDDHPSDCDCDGCYVEAAHRFKRIAQSRAAAGVKGPEKKGDTGAVISYPPFQPNRPRARSAAKQLTIEDGSRRRKYYGPFESTPEEYYKIDAADAESYIAQVSKSRNAFPDTSALHIGGSSAAKRRPSRSSQASEGSGHRPPRPDVRSSHVRRNSVQSQGRAESHASYTSGFFVERDGVRFLVPENCAIAAGENGELIITNRDREKRYHDSTRSATSIPSVGSRNLGSAGRGLQRSESVRTAAPPMISPTWFGPPDDGF